MYEPPSAILTSVASALLAIDQKYSRSNEPAAVLLTVRSLPTHSSTVSSAVWPVSVMVAVLSYLVQVPATPDLSSAYSKVCSPSDQFRVPRVTGLAGSVLSSMTVMILLVSVGVMSVKSTAAVPEALVLGRPAAAGHVAVAVLVPVAIVGSAAYVQVYALATESFPGTVRFVPFVTTQLPPLPTASVTSTPVMG